MGNQGYYDTPHAWEAPTSFEVTEDTEFSVFDSPAGEDYNLPAPISQPFNPPALGLGAFYSNALKSMYEIILQQKPSIPSPPSLTYDGPLGGAGPLRLFAPAPGSQKYKDFVARQAAKENYNPEKIGVAPLANNAKSTAIETAKQTEGPNLWERFTGAIQEGYTKEPEDVNVFTKSAEQLVAAATGVVKPSSYILLAVGGIVLLVLLIK